MIKRKTYHRHKEDFVSEELVAVLLEHPATDFHTLFRGVHTRLRARNAASGGEEMLRLRTYERLQGMVTQGLVKKDGKTYSPIKTTLQARSAEMTAAKAAAQLRRSAVLHVE